MKSPLISVIIPTYNRGQLIIETLNSLICQNYINWECIIVDDGSSDNSVEIIKKFISQDDRFQLLNRPYDKKKGANSCRNYGFEKSIGDLINWFDSDDIYEPNALFEYQRAFKECTDVVIGKLEKVDFYTNVSIGFSKIVSDNIIEEYFLGKIAYFVSGPMWRREFLNERKILFDENISNLDDWDFNLRMLYYDPVITYLDSALIQYRIHTTSISHEIGKLNFREIQSELRAREKHLILISQNKKANVVVLKKFILFRYKYFFRESMIQNDKHRIFYLKNLIKKEIEVVDFGGAIKTIFGFCIYSIFNRGYKFLK